MKSIISKLLLMVFTTSIGLINASSFMLSHIFSRHTIRVAEKLPQIEGVPQINQLNDLPYPLNYIEAYKALSAAQRETLQQQLPPREKLIFKACQAVEAGVLAVRHTELLEQHNIKQIQEKKWGHWKGTALIAGTYVLPE